MATNLTGIEGATTLTPTETTIRDFLIQEVLYDKELGDLGAEDSLLESELLDSISIMQLVAFCEQVFEIIVPEEELLPDNFESVRTIGHLVERRLAHTTA
jgi:D-alanine--poly(phosphoribitol) ligase subunit 2